MQTKACTKCGRELPATAEYFFRCKKEKDGLRYECKNCTKLVNEKYKIENKDKLNEYYRRYWKENKEKIAIYRKEYRRENKDKIAAQCKKYAQKNRDKMAEYYRKYIQKNKEKCRLGEIRRSNKRRTIKKSLPAYYTTEQWQQCKEYFNNACCYCGKKTKLAQDHFIPLTKNGQYTRDNIVPCCKSCNSKKRTYDFFEWYPQQEFYSVARERKILKYLNYNGKTQQQLGIF